MPNPPPQREAGTTVLTASYLPSGSQVHCRYLSSRKVALVDSGGWLRSGSVSAPVQPLLDIRP